MAANVLERAKLVRFALDNLSTDNGHHEFEHLCRAVARVRICANLLPSTGPVSSGGDGGIDFESFWTESEKTSIVFCCSLQKDVSSKILHDLERVKKSRPECGRVFFFSNQPIPIACRNRLCEQATTLYGIRLEVLDGEALTELLLEPDLEWIARERLRIPSGSTDSEDSLLFEAVELDIAQCAWQRISKTADPRVPLGSHLLRIDMWPEERRTAELRTFDPIFDLTVVNRSRRPLILIGVGFEPVNAWTRLKGLPVAERIVVCESYELKVAGFEYGQPQILALPDPFYLPSEAPFRFKLRLRDYRAAVPGNQSIIRLAARVADTVFRSAPMHLGLV